MKFLRYFLFLFLVLQTFVFFSSCSSCSNKKEHKVTIEELQAVNKEDTLRALNMTKQFMEELKNNNVDGAVNMLVTYFPGNDSLAATTSHQKESLKQQFKTMPVLDYEVQTSNFMTHEMATVTYRYRFMDNPTTDPNYPCYTSITLAVRYIKDKYQMYLYNHRVIN